MENSIIFTYGLINRDFASKNKYVILKNLICLEMIKTEVEFRVEYKNLN